MNPNLAYLTKFNHKAKVTWIKAKVNLTQIQLAQSNFTKSLLTKALPYNYMYANFTL